MLVEPVRDHLKRKGKEPHFGSEKTLYKLQGQVLDLPGSLTSLWADLLIVDAKVKREAVAGAMDPGPTGECFQLNHSKERRQISWSHLNPLIRDFYLEEEDKRKKGTALFGGEFLEKATKKVEEDKALTKVMGAQKTPHQPNNVNILKTPETFAIFLDKGVPARYIVKKQQRQQLYNRYHNSRKSQNPKYPQQQTGPPKKQSK